MRKKTLIQRVRSCMSDHILKYLPLSVAAILLGSASALTQQRPVVTTITGHVAKAERLEPTEPRPPLLAPAGCGVVFFAPGFGKPRVLAAAAAGPFPPPRRDTGDVIMLRDRDR